jgi:hypothetical protein
MKSFGNRCRLRLIASLKRNVGNSVDFCQIAIQHHSHSADCVDHSVNLLDQDNWFRLSRHRIKFRNSRSHFVTLKVSAAPRIPFKDSSAENSRKRRKDEVRTKILLRQRLQRSRQVAKYRVTSSGLKSRSQRSAPTDSFSQSQTCCSWATARRTSANVFLSAPALLVRFAQGARGTFRCAITALGEF